MVSRHMQIRNLGNMVGRTNLIDRTYTTNIATRKSVEMCTEFGLVAM
jgi:hypothetical protein